MAKRMVIMLGATLAFLGVLGFVKFRQVKGAIAQASSFQPPPEAVTTVVAAEETWPATVSAIGTLTAVQGVRVAADLPGIVEQIAFESGASAAAGQVLVRLDSRQEQAQLAAARAELELARLTLARSRELSASGVISAADLDRSVATADQAAARVGEIQATLARKTIRAPFAGLLGIRQVNLGQYLASGDPIVALEALDPVYADFTVPQQEIGRFTAGMAVEVAVQGVEGSRLPGKVTAIETRVDEATRNAMVRAEIANPDGRLRPGMFVEVHAAIGTGRTVVPLPASAVSYAPYGDSVFIVEDVTGPDGRTYRGVRQQFVTLSGSRGDQVAVASGVKAGEEVVTSGGFKLRNGAAVVVDNQVRPANERAPEREDS